MHSMQTQLKATTPALIHEVILHLLYRWNFYLVAMTYIMRSLIVFGWQISLPPTARVARFSMEDIYLSHYICPMRQRFVTGDMKWTETYAAH